MNPYRANKSLGQHFLCDQNVLRHIGEQFPEAQALVEIGPGTGQLTRQLTQRGLPLKLIEKDRRFGEKLCTYVGSDSLYIQDALTFDLEAHFQHWGWRGKKIWLASNLPYNVQAPLLVKFLACPSISFMTLMLQREVAQKIYGTKMNSLAALAKAFFEVKLSRKVAPGAFSPPPRVESTVLNFKRLQNPAIPLEQFAEYQLFLRQLFRFRRKQVGTVLQDLSATPLLDKLKIERSRRSETFQMHEVCQLYQQMAYTPINNHNKSKGSAHSLGRPGVKRDRATEACSQHVARSDGEAEPQDGLKCEQLP